uniref:Uncharacterized protein n=1 Tax=Leersia perrieri TaxID=77586 RepID=A0A0D9X6U3_9ORYZ
MGEVRLLKAEMERLLDFLRAVNNSRGSAQVQEFAWIRQIRDATYDASNTIGEAEYIRRRNRLKKGLLGAISRYSQLPSDLVKLHNVYVQCKRVRRRISKIFQSLNSFVNLGIGAIRVGRTEEEFEPDHGPVCQPFEDDIVVGFQIEFNEIVEKLLEKQENNLSVISIVGMGGAGKTTLARKVCSSPIIKEHFGTILWVKGIDLISKIMKQIMEPGNESREINQKEYKMRTKIHDFLLKKRYLVVLDDVWQTNAWDKINDVVKVFPDVNNSSRVLLTTRKEDVANHIQMPTHVYDLQFLDDEKSWELFRNKALPSYKRSMVHDLDVFEDLGRKLAKKCNGLPLALTVLGGYLSKNLSVEAWKDIIEGCALTEEGEMMGKILARSYNDLPNHYLKSCFLYFSAFPEDHMMCVPDLIGLWISEGFIPETRTYSLEETARKYVTELAQRNLVQVVHRSRVHGCIERIQIHDIFLHGWCIKEARDGFLDVINKTAGKAGESSSITLKAYRTSFQNFYDHEILQETPNLQTLLGFSLPSMSLMPDVKFLRVLHIENSSLKDFSRKIAGYIHLRCLRLRRCEHVVLPSSISQLIFLQTVDLRDTQLDLGVPYSMWDIPSLKHVYLESQFSAPWNRRKKGIQTLSLNIPRYSNCFQSDFAKLLRQMAQLTTLHLDMRDIPEDIIKTLSKMPRLVELYLDRFDRIDKLPDSQHFSQNLRDLVLIAAHLRQDPMPVLEKLPNLMVLRIQGYDGGESIYCSTDGFPRLQELELKLFSIIKWRIKVRAMPRLSYLTLRCCQEMPVLPLDFLNLPSLKELKLDGMPQITSDQTTYRELERKGCKVMKCF